MGCSDIRCHHPNGAWFTLLDAPSIATGLANAKLNLHVQGWQQAPQTPVLVQFPIDYVGVGTADVGLYLFPDAVAGCQGYAEWNNYEQRWVVVWCEQKATICKALCAEDASSGPNDFDVDNVQPINGYSPVDSTATVINVDNTPLNLEVDNNSVVYIQRNAGGNTWYAFQGRCAGT